MNGEPCMCGATDCWSCGPAQGYEKCENCGRFGCYCDEEEEEEEENA